MKPSPQKMEATIPLASSGDRDCVELTLEKVCVDPHCSIREAMERIDANAKGIVLVVGDRRKLMGTVTDGDIRRHVLARRSMDTTVGDLIHRKQAESRGPHLHPVTARVGMPADTLLALMRQRVVRQVPLLDEEDQVVDLITMDDLVPKKKLPLQAVIMAGGFGTRLRPLTAHVPKPMLPVGEKPLMELILKQLEQAGIHRVNVTTHYMPEKIVDYFKDGSDFGVEMNYVNEESPLGTAGALGLIEECHEPLLVMNGDILTGVDFRELHAFHAEHQAAMTVGVRKYEINVPYGVVEHQAGKIDRIVEKPSLEFFVNAGIYLVESRVRKHIPSNKKFDMPDLIHKLIEQGESVITFPIFEYWLDIGKPTDYERAQIDMQQGRIAA